MPINRFLLILAIGAMLTHLSPLALAVEVQNAGEIELTPDIIAKTNVTHGVVTGVRSQEYKLILLVTTDKKAVWEILIRKNLKDIHKDGKAASWKDIKMGDQVRIRHMNNGDRKQVASQVDIYDSKTPSKDAKAPEILEILEVLGDVTDSKTPVPPGKKLIRVKARVKLPANTASAETKA